MHSTRRLRLSEVNPHLVCVLCGGYFVDATTIVECLHSFCRSCLIKYLEGNSFCPICDVQIHKAKPFLNIKPDKALQDIVYKLVPGLFHSEMRRRREFYAKHPERIYETTPEGRGVGVERLIYSPDDSISLSLEYLDGEEEDVSCTSSHSSESGQENGVSKRYLQCPALVTIGHLKKFLRNKYELTPMHSVEIVHRRESLPDDYTLMDVAYIYTWKRNGPMRFFFRIIQSKQAVSSVVQSTPSITNGAISVEDSSSTQSSSQLINTVPHSTQPILSNSENVPSKPPPKVESPKPTPKPDSQKHGHELQSNVSVRSSTQSPETDTVVSSEIVKASLPPTSTTQSTSTSVTKCAQSKAVPVTVSSSPITCAVAPTLSNQTTSDDLKDKETNKLVTKSPSHQPPAAVTKTETVVKAIPSLPSSSTSNVPSSVSDTNTNEISANMDLVTNVSLEDPPLSTPNILSQNTPIVIENKSSQNKTLPVTEQSIPKSNTKEITQPSSTKIPVSQPIKENQKQQNQPVSSQPSGGSSLTQKPNQISNGVANSADSEAPSQTPLDKPPVEVKNFVTQSQEERPTKIIKTEPELTTPNGNVKVLKEDNQKSITSNNSTALGTPTNPKALLNKQILQRLQNSARKTSIPMKYVSDPSSTKAPQSTARTQSLITKDSVKFPRVNQKSGDKQVAPSDITTSKKENTQAKSNSTEKYETVKESSHTTTNLQIKIEKDTLNSTVTSHTPVNNINNNNINKVPPQNQQIIRNNQQILRKNDEIMRCVTTVKRPIQPIPRKTSDVLKNSAQFRAAEDKMNAKKRRVPINSMKRPAPTTLDASKIDEVQPMVKKLKPTIENNHKPSVFEQKQSQSKMRFANTLAGQTPLYATKSESTIESTSNSMKNGSTNTFNTSDQVSGSENKCNNIKAQESERKNCVNENAPSISVHRPQHNSQTNISPKISINSAIKKESPSSKPDIQSTMRRSPARTLSGQNMTPPPIPAVAHSNMINSRLCPTPHPPSVKPNSSADPDGAGALDLSSSPRRQQSQSILSIAQSLARRQQQQCPSPAPPPLSPLSSLSPFPVMASMPVRSPPPQLRIPVPPQHRTGHSHQQQRPSSLSSSSPSPPADIMPGSSRMGPPQQQQQPLTPDMYPPHLLNPAALMFRQQLELQRLWSTGKHNPTSGMEWFTDANSIKRFESFMKSLQQQQQQQQQQQSPGRNSPFYPFNNNNNTAAAANNHRK